MSGARDNGILGMHLVLTCSHGKKEVERFLRARIPLIRAQCVPSAVGNSRVMPVNRETPMKVVLLKVLVCVVTSARGLQVQAHHDPRAVVTRG